MRLDRPSTRRALALFAVVGACAAAAALGATLAVIARDTGRTAGWARDRYAQRLLAESGVEELMVALRRVANDPDHPAFDALRQDLGRDQRAALPLQTPATLAAIAAFARATGAEGAGHGGAYLIHSRKQGDDPLNRTGAVELTHSVTVRRGGREHTETYTQVHGFSCARAFLPTPLHQASHSDRLHVCDRDPHDMIAPCKQFLQERQREKMRDGDGSPPLVQYTLTSEELHGEFEARLAHDRPLHGVVSVPGNLELACTGFRGICRLRVDGDVTLGAITMATPHDWLTIEVGGQLTLRSGPVEAHLQVPGRIFDHEFPKEPVVIVGSLSIELELPGAGASPRPKWTQTLIRRRTPFQQIGPDEQQRKGRLYIVKIEPLPRRVLHTQS